MRESGGDTRLLVTGATIWAGADCVPRPGWLLVDGGVIAGIGGPDTAVPDAGDTVDATGRHILPGFVDTHTHLSVAASQPEGTDGAACRCLADALHEVERAARADLGAPWLVVWNVSVHGWPERRLPTVDELDAAAPGRKVLVCGVDLHRGAVSSAALEEMAFARTPRHRPAEDVVRDRHGRPTGELWEAAFGSALARAIADTDAHRGDAGAEPLLAEAWRHLSLGITHAHDPYVPPSLHQRMLALRGGTPMRLSWTTGSGSGLLHPPDDPAAAPDGPYGDGPREVKIFLDGADHCALRLPPRALPSLVGGTVRDAWRVRGPGPVRDGLRRRLTFHDGGLEMPYLRFTDAGLAAVLDGYAAAGFRLRLHALGNLAAGQAARALGAAGVGAGLATVDHLTVLDEATADLVAASGAYAGLQPGFLPRFGPQFTAAGIDRHLSVLGGRLLTASGAPPVLSSDHPCGSLDPLRNLRTAVDRGLAGGRVLQPEQALTPEEAVRAATTRAARSLDACGSGGLSPGEVADLVICTGDPFEESTRVAETWVGGVRAWPR